MTDTNPTPAMKAELGVGRIIGGAFDLYFKNFPLFFGVVFIPYLIYATLIVTPFQTALAEAGISGDASSVVAPFLTYLAATMIFFILLQAVIVRMSISLHTQMGAQIGAAIKGAVFGLLPMLVLGTLAGLASGIAFLFLIVPGLYVVAIIYVYVPAIVFEGAGFSALGRSETLTKGYRWAIIGLLILLALINIAVMFGAGILIAIVGLAVDPNVVQEASDPVTAIWMNILSSALQAVVLPIGLIASGLVYARLREIKEGGSTGDLLKVFE